MIRPGEIIIDESNYANHINPIVDGNPVSRGLVQRNFNTHPVGYLGGICPAMEGVNIPLIPRNEWSDRIKDLVATKSQLSDIRLTGNKGNPIPSLDQNGKGYCWAHSSTAAVMLTRAIMGEPYVPLSAYAVACMEKNFRDEGGWGAESLEFISNRGVPSSEFWPMQSMSRANDNPATWENAARHKVVDGWVDLQQDQYDRKLNFDQVATLLLCRVPVVCDFHWWGHSVCALDLVEPSPGQFGVRILNSWGDDWSDRGMGVLSPAHSVPNGAVAPRVLVTSLV
jgi:hypothetical protein